MRICFVSHATSHFTTPYIDYFSDLGHDVHLVSLFPTQVANAVNHHPLPTFSGPGLRTLSYLRALLPVRRAVRSIAPCLVHAHYLTSNGVLAAFAGWRPLILSAHGSDLHRMANPLRRAAVAYALRRADLVNPVSLHMKRVLLSLGVAPARLLTLSQGVDTTRFVVDRARRREGPAHVLCTRRLEARYNCIAIVQALSILKNRRIACHVIFAGTGPQEARLRREVFQRGLAAEVTFLGGYRQSELPGLLARADIYVSAKPTDGTSVSLLEAMASGLFPVVADIPGNREWLTGEGDSLLFHPTDVGGLAACLQAAIENVALRRHAVDVNRRRVRRDGERTTNLARLAAVYRELAARNGCRT